MSSTFDTLAATYDDDFTQSPIARWLRDKVHQQLSEMWQSGDHILELGCGTGEDALWLAEQGIHVTATDASVEMLQITQAKLSNQPHVQVKRLDFQQLPSNDFDAQYDGVLSDFGALNCVEDYTRLATWLALRTKPNAVLAFAIMAPYCLWETAWHGIHLNLRTAFRRWDGETDFDLGDNTPPIKIYYPRPKHIQQNFTPYFELHRLRPLGVFLPPSDVYPVIEKRPRVLKQLLRLEERWGQTKWLAIFADHYWIELKRTTNQVSE